MKGDTDLNFQGNILIYQNEKGDTKVDAYFNDSTIWMTQKSISQLYQTSPQNVTLHIKNIYADGELYEEATCKDYLQVQSEGSRTVQRKVKIYNYTNNFIKKAFGRNEKPTFEEYEEFLESRCFPRQRDKIKLVLEDLNLPFYDPFMIIEKTEGRMAEDDFWIRIEK